MHDIVHRFAAETVDLADVEHAMRTKFFMPGSKRPLMQRYFILCIPSHCIMARLRVMSDGKMYTNKDGIAYEVVQFEGQTIQSLDNATSAALGVFQIILSFRKSIFPGLPNICMLKIVKRHDNKGRFLRKGMR